MSLRPLHWPFSSLHGVITFKMAQFNFFDHQCLSFFQRREVPVISDTAFRIIMAGHLGHGSIIMAGHLGHGSGSSVWPVIWDTARSSKAGHRGHGSGPSVAGHHLTRLETLRWPVIIGRGPVHERADSLSGPVNQTRLAFATDSLRGHRPGFDHMKRESEHC